MKIFNFLVERRDPNTKEIVFSDTYSGTEGDFLEATAITNLSGGNLLIGKPEIVEENINILGKYFHCGDGVYKEELGEPFISLRSEEKFNVALSSSEVLKLIHELTIKYLDMTGEAIHLVMKNTPSFAKDVSIIEHNLVFGLHPNDPK